MIPSKRKRPSSTREQSVWAVEKHFQGSGSHQSSRITADEDNIDIVSDDEEYHDDKELSEDEEDEPLDDGNDE